MISALMLLPLIGSVAYAESTAPSPALTSAQKAQAARVARKTEHINPTNGYVSVGTSVLAQHGLSTQQIGYVTSTIRAFDAKHGLTAASPATTSVGRPLAVSANAGIWYNSAAFTQQMVMLYEGVYSANSWGWQHMSYRHNWLTGAGQKAVEIAVHQAQYWAVQSYNSRYVYDKWFTTTVPFENWSVLIEVIVSPGNATGKNLYGPGSVVTAYPIAGSYKTQTWRGVLGTSIVPWWINDGYYAQTLK
ncbi:MAG: hypothetical protein M0Z53_14755 [Thermaerobacter sp.]|nr:hypothetical protein [Thermaerobacter sp.]